MAEFVLAVLVVALVVYTVFGGADFGAGIIEPFLRTPGDIDVALGPVWEANHVWLVLALVLAFVGFPEFHALVTTYLHLPLLGVLLGIVARGTAFTFRHYDPNPGALGPWYNIAFRLGSLMTPLCLGLCVAAIASSEFPTDPQAGFYAWYVGPWNTPFCWATGVFVCALFAFEGAALLSAEQSLHGLPLPYISVARFMHLAAIGSGALVFAVAWVQHVPWFKQLMASGLALIPMTVATLLIPVVANAFDRGHPWRLRAATAVQVTCILSGFFAGQFPVLLRLDNRVLTYKDAAAPDATMRTLIVALVVGLIVILPSLVFLIRVYKGSPEAQELAGNRSH
jgi:cytochrome d ubiquinol oxidase subunit II